MVPNVFSLGSSPSSGYIAATVAAGSAVVLSIAIVKFFIVDRVVVVTSPLLEVELSPLLLYDVASSSRESLEHAVVIPIIVIAATNMMYFVVFFIIV